MSAKQLLLDIRDFIVASSDANLTEGDRDSLKFSSGDDIVEAIDTLLEDAIEQEEFNPYVDPETRAMLERAGIATYKHRNKF